MYIWVDDFRYIANYVSVTYTQGTPVVLKYYLSSTSPLLIISLTIVNPVSQYFTITIIDLVSSSFLN